MDLRPIRFQHAEAWRSYFGGKLIAKLHGEDAEDGHFPEEWILSTVRVQNAGREDIEEGLSRTPDGKSLKELLEQAPMEMLGADHVGKYGSNMGVLVKLLDAAIRLSIQVHPSPETARELFHSNFGKTECWHILETRNDAGESPCVYLGFRPGVTREHWEDVFYRQNITEMLACLHRFDAAPGDTFLIRGGVPHAIGAGCLMVEIQEPTDLTILTERVALTGYRFPDSSMHRGLGFEKMFDCFDYTTHTKEEAAKLWKLTGTVTQTPGCTCREVVGYNDTPMFRLEIMDVTDDVMVPSDGVFSGLYILEGTGTLDGERVNAGTCFFVPASCSQFALIPDSTMRCFRFWGPKCG